MKLLNGLELADFIKERQAHEVRGLKQSKNITPRLAIVLTSDNPVIKTYVQLKQAYAEDIQVETEMYSIQMEELNIKINELNKNDAINGIILQLPLANPGKTDEFVKMINPKKDVDGLGSDKFFTPATAMAIDWLANGYNINLNEKRIAIVGSHGRLVGKPLMKLWAAYNPTGFNSDSDLNELKNFDLIVSATGRAGIIKSDFISPNSTVIDAGTVSEGGKLVGDVDPELYKRDDLTITPQKGGVGPLTVCALMDNVIHSISR